MESKAWSTGTLDSGIQCVNDEAQLADLEEEELRLELELQERFVGAAVQQ